MAGEPAIVLSGVWKRFPGGVEALRGVDLVVGAGEVVALAGPNGAGKTTTLRIIAGLLKPDQGEALVLGFRPWEGRREFKRVLGYLPEDAGVYRRMSGLEFLRFTARLYAGSPGEAEEMVARAVEISGLSMEDLRRPAGRYSKGMRRRLLIARTLMTGPRVVVLDEPTSGVDVEHAVAIRNIIRGLAREGAAVLLSSHNLMETEILADRVYIISGGRIVASGRPEDLKKRYGVGTLEEVYLEAVREAGGGAEG